MASGSFNVTTSNTYIKGRVDWSSVSNGSSANSSNVTATLRLWRTNTGYTTDRVIKSALSINGNTKNSEARHQLAYNSNTLIATHTVTVPHNSDGKKP